MAFQNMTIAKEGVLRKAIREKKTIVKMTN